MSEEQAEQPEKSGDEAPSHVVIVGPDGQQVAVPASALQPPATTDESDLTSLVEQPAKVMRIGSMIRQLLEEVKAAPLDEASRQRLKEIYRQSIKELESGLAPELVEELERLTLPFTGSEAPTDAELRISQAQLVGWLEGLFHGIQTAIYAQQMAARAQFEQIRRALPPGVQIAGQPGPGGPGQDGQPGEEGRAAGPRLGRHVPLTQRGRRERPRAPKTISPSRPTSSMAAPGAAIRVSDAGSAPSTDSNTALSGVGGIGVVPWPSSATSRWVRALVAGPVPPQLFASRFVALARARRTGSGCRRSSPSARTPTSASDLTVTVGEVMFLSPL